MLGQMENALVVPSGPGLSVDETDVAAVEALGESVGQMDPAPPERFARR